MRVLPEDLRDILKTQIGQLFKNEEEIIKNLSKEKFVVSVGDLVTYTLLKNDLKPIFCIVDYKTRRGQCSEEIVSTIKSYTHRINNQGFTTMVNYGEQPFDIAKEVSVIKGDLRAVL